VPFVALATGAVLSLYLRPADTDDYFAWTIAPPFTAALLGAAYGGTLVFFALSLRERAWADVRLAVSAPLTLSTAMLVATLLHLDKFHLDDGGVPAVVAWIWLVVYLVVPPALVAVVVAEQRTPGVDPDRVAQLPTLVRGVLVVMGVCGLVGGVALFGWPSELAEHWPWAITPLTARAIAAWMLGLAVAALHSAYEDDLRRLRSGIAALATIGALGLVACARYRDDLDGGVGTVVLVGVLGLLFVLGALGLVLERRAATA
jgi:hypothetical protein